jgi:hypothetical protein
LFSVEISVILQQKQSEKHKEIAKYENYPKLTDNLCWTFATITIACSMLDKRHSSDVLSFTKAEQEKQLREDCIPFIFEVLFRY